MGSRFHHITRSAVSVFTSSKVVPLLCRSFFRVDLHVFLGLPLPLLPPVDIQSMALRAGRSDAMRITCPANWSLLSATTSISIVSGLSLFLYLQFRPSKWILESCVDSFDERRLIYYVSVLYFLFFACTDSYWYHYIPLNTVSLWCSASRTCMDLHIFSSLLKTAGAFANLVFTSASTSLSFVMTLPRCVNLPTHSSFTSTHISVDFLFFICHLNICLYVADVWANHFNLSRQ